MGAVCLRGLKQCKIYIYIFFIWSLLVRRHLFDHLLWSRKNSVRLLILPAVPRLESWAINFCFLLILQTWLRTKHPCNVLFIMDTLRLIMPCPYNVDDIIWEKIKQRDKEMESKLTWFNNLTLCPHLDKWIWYYVHRSFDIRSNPVWFPDFRSILVFPTFAQQHSID